MQACTGKSTKVIREPSLTFLYDFSSSLKEPSHSKRETYQTATLTPSLSLTHTMPRRIKVAAAQVGAVHRTTPRAEVLARLIKLVEEAAEQGVKLAVFREWGKGVVYV